MLNSLKTSAAVLAGLLLGCVAALMIAWYGSRIGANALQKNVWGTLDLVQSRQQEMSDQALKLQPVLTQFGVTANADVFEDVQDLRSRLAGEADLQDKLARVQDLEEALLRAEQVWLREAQGHKRLAEWEPYREHARLWEKQKRLLVAEQKDLQDSVDELNGLLLRWPLSVLLAHQSFMAMLNDLLGDAWGNAMFLVRLSLDWTGYSLRRVAALVGQQTPPEPPQWGHRPQALAEPGYFEPLPRLIFLASAPPPEDQYTELQFTRAVRENYADVDLGEDKAVLENRTAPGAYAPVVPQPQKTVVYSAQH